MFDKWKELVIKNKYVPTNDELTLQFIYENCPLLFMPSTDEQERYEMAELIENAIRYGQQNRGYVG